jgi:hypothetical protein
LSKAQYQATGRVLVVRIIFNDTTISRRLTNLALADVALNDSSQSMAGKLKFAICQLSQDLLDGLHSTASICSTTLFCGEPSPGSRSRAMRSAFSSVMPSGMGEIVSGRGVPL